MGHYEECMRLSEIAKRIAAQMGEDWQYTDPPEQGYRWREIKQADGAALSVSFGYRDNERLIIRGMPARDMDNTHVPYSEKYPEIGVSMKKSTERIVSDIRRRLLPDYLQLRERGLEILARQKADRDAENEDMAEIALILPEAEFIRRGERRNGRGYSAAIVRQRNIVGDVDVEFEATFRGGKCRVKVEYTPLELAKRIAVVIAEYATERANMPQEVDIEAE